MLDPPWRQDRRHQKTHWALAGIAGRDGVLADGVVRADRARHVRDLEGSGGSGASAA